MTPFLTQRAELCRTERTRGKWVIVPTHTPGHTLGEQLALGGTGSANVRFSTLSRSARQPPAHRA